MIKNEKILAKKKLKIEGYIAINTEKNSKKQQKKNFKEKVLRVPIQIKAGDQVRSTVSWVLSATEWPPAPGHSSFLRRPLTMAVLRFVFSLLFLFRVRLRGFSSFHALIRGRYGNNLLTTCRALEKTTRRLRKAEMDLEFLQYCRLSDVAPNFVKI